MINAYPAPLQQILRNFEHVVRAWARAAQCSIEDVRQEIALAALTGQNPAAAVPRALGVRKLPGAGWVSTDLSVVAAVNDCVFDVERHDIELHAETEEYEEKGIGGTEQIARRLGVSRRRAQQLVAQQSKRFEQGGDLFAAGALT